jgi:hypothetical protein
MTMSWMGAGRLYAYCNWERSIVLTHFRTFQLYGYMYDTHIINIMCATGG